MMTRFSNARPVPPILRTTLLALLAPAALAGALVHPAAASAGEASEIRIAVADGQADEQRIRRRIASAARAVCGQGGLAALYRNAGRRCRAEVRADAERQLAHRHAARPLLASSQGR